jgi:hypothetical protein
MTPKTLNFLENSVTSATLKNVLLAYYRFERGYSHVVTEFFDADVVVSNQKIAIECEIKISWKDYRADWSKKKHTENYRSMFKPNMFYFVAPIELAQRIKLDLDERKSKYGVIGVTSNGSLQTLKRASKLHTKPVSDKILERIVARLTSELITLRYKVETLQQVKD